MQIVIALLMLASLYSWMIIFRKRFMIGRSRREADQFENQFWSGGDLAQLYRAIESRGGSTGMANIFEFGFREFARLRQQAGPARPDVGRRAPGYARRAIEGDRPARAESGDARDRGLHQPLRRIVRHRLGHDERVLFPRNVQQATLAMVAPGISEALITTAFGLFAAIPAVIAYNRFADQVARLEIRFDAFTEEFSSILQRHAPAAPVTAAWFRPATRVRREAMASVNKGRRLMGEINVVPYINVMLVLLIILMITAPLLTQGIKVDLPKAGAEPGPENAQRRHSDRVVGR